MNNQPSVYCANDLWNFFGDKEIKLYLLLLRNLPDYVNFFAYITLSSYVMIRMSYTQVYDHMPR